MSLRTLEAEYQVESTVNVCHNSYVFRKLANREDFLSMLLFRLQWVPQLFLEYGMRTRYDHIMNGIKIKSKLNDIGMFDALEIKNHEVAEVTRRFQYHDIGHHRYGHAGERALNDFSLLLGGPSFSNCSFSRYLQEFEDLECKKAFSKFNFNLFNTRTESSNKISYETHKLIKFIDDLENITGDLLDLNRYYRGGRVDHLIELFAGKKSENQSEIINEFSVRFLNSPSQQIQNFENPVSECKELMNFVMGQIASFRINDHELEETDARWYLQALNEMEQCYTELSLHPDVEMMEKQEIIESSLYIAALL